MAYIHLTFNSQQLNGNTELSVFYPDPPRTPGMFGPSAAVGEPLRHDKSRRWQVLWLIHGGGDDHTAWPLDAMIQRKCNQARIVVVMPTIRDFTDLTPGANYRRFVAEELPEFIGFLLPISRRPQDNFIAGLSYGGYFSYRVALNHPEQYACVGSFASPIDVAMDIRRLHMNSPFHPDPDEIPGTERDVMGLAAKLKAEGRKMPRLYQACGTEDFTWDFNVSARDHFRAIGVDHTWVEGPGMHNFEFWDEHLKRFVDWLPLEGGTVDGREDA